MRYLLYYLAKDINNKTLHIEEVADVNREIELKRKYIDNYDTFLCIVGTYPSLTRAEDKKKTLLRMEQKRKSRASLT